MFNLYEIIKKTFEDFEKEREIRRKNPKLYAKSFYSSPERFNAPLTNLAQDLVFGLKEGLIRELVIISSFRRARSSEGIEVKKFLEKAVAMKKDKIRKTFPSATLEATEIGKINGVNRPHRWEIIKKNHSDFDIYIDDNIGQLTSTRKNFEGESKIYVTNDYLANRKFKFLDLYHVKTIISDLKN